MAIRLIYDFEEIHRGGSGVIIGGGKSIRDLDLSRITLPTIGTNNIFLTGFTPTYYCIEDWLVATDRRKEIEQIDCHRFYGSHLKDLLEDGIWISSFMRTKYPTFPHFSENLNELYYTGGTVTYMALQLAFWMGFKTVYLLGIDHDYEIPKDYAERIHQDIFIALEDDPNHYDPTYFGKGFRFHDPKPKRMEKAYQKAKQVFEENGRIIYNANEGSKLDLFEKVPVDRITAPRN